MIHNKRMTSIEALDIIAKSIDWSNHTATDEAEIVAEKAIEAMAKILFVAREKIANMTDEPLDEAIARGAIKPRDW